MLISHRNHLHITFLFICTELTSREQLEIITYSEINSIMLVISQQCQHRPKPPTSCFLYFPLNGGSLGDQCFLVVAASLLCDSEAAVRKTPNMLSYFNPFVGVRFPPTLPVRQEASHTRLDLCSGVQIYLRSQLFKLKSFILNNETGSEISDRVLLESLNG